MLNLDAPDNSISDNESSSEMLTSQNQISSVDYKNVEC